MQTKTQISELINGSENTFRKLDAPKYNGVKLRSNKPDCGGTPYEKRHAIALAVGAENPGDLKIRIAGKEYTLQRYNSLSGKSWYWDGDIDPETYGAIKGYIPRWTHKGADNSYSILVDLNCQVSLIADSGKKNTQGYIDEAFIEIL